MLFIISFFLGDLFLQTLTTLPTRLTIVGALLFSFLLWMLLRKTYKFVYLLPAFFLGFAHSAWYALNFVAWSLPTNMEGQTLLATGYIASLPTTTNDRVGFIFELTKLAHVSVPHIRIQLSWKQPFSELKVGDQWQLTLRLKRIHSTQSPGAFDYEAWALQHSLRARGYVIASSDNQYLNHFWYRYPIERFRQLLSDRITQVLPSSMISSSLYALTIGEHATINKEEWQILRNTGTNHLLAIAGLHIGIIAAFHYWLVSRLWRTSQLLTMKIPAQQAGKIASLIMAILYSAAAGFSLPTQRACIMVTSYIASLCLRSRINPWHPLILALFIVVLLNPASVLSESLWLSFGTLTLIIFGMHGRIGPHTKWWRWGRIQWLLGLGLIPLSLIFFQQCSLISFIANSFAVPWMTFTILPFCFLGTMSIFFLPSIATVLFGIANFSLSVMWIVLNCLSQLNFSTWHFSLVQFATMANVCFGIVLLLLPNGFPGRWLGLLFLLALIGTTIPKPQVGDFWLSALDVGQGMALLIQTNKHVLIYDTGAEYEKLNMGEAIVAPYLYSLGINRIDTLVISHADNDHSGGARTLLQLFHINKIATGTPKKLQQWLRNTTLVPCLNNERWTWDGVQFSFVHPSASMLDLGNNSSCVLRIENEKQSVLLTGDIEKFAIRKLLDTSAHLMSTTVLVAPHHGSKSSFLKEFVLLTHPQIVVFATGYKNQYHFPHPQVVAAFKQIGTKIINTTETGTVLLKFEKKLMSPTVECYRQNNKHYWYSEKSHSCSS